MSACIGVIQRRTFTDCRILRVAPPDAGDAFGGKDRAA
ncbi:hypothetical protein XCR_4385 [Xanthomonas campestris pv. raphani 756C]|nr:hypothetical protein XCR_4385 [Xanthomonas campestris pv. raphani 756C]